MIIPQEMKAVVGVREKAASILISTYFSSLSASPNVRFLAFSPTASAFRCFCADCHAGRFPVVITTKSWMKMK